MKRFLAVCMLMTLLLAGCSQKPAESKQQEQSKYLQEREGIWVSADGADYVCIFPNGSAIAYDGTSLREGVWLEDTGAVLVQFASGAVVENEEWTYSVKESSVRYVYDSGTLVADGRTEYTPVVTADAFRMAAEHIDAYNVACSDAWASQAEMTVGAGTVAELWSGLEQQLFFYLMQIVDDADALQAEEDNWLAERDAAMEQIRQEYAGGSAASLMIASEKSDLAQARFALLLDRLS